MSDIAVVIGTRPETVKMAPVIKALQKRKMGFCFIHTGQHYDYNMSREFIEVLNLPNPDYSFELKNHAPAAQIGEMITKLEKVLSRVNSKILLVQGDTNTMLASALTGVKLGIRVGHIEAGLRSYDWRMPEEHNRRMVDHVSDLLFTPTEIAKRNLHDEHVYGEIYVTGNTVVDAVLQHMSIAEKNSDVMSKILFREEEYALVTIHRVENVDEPRTLKDLISALLNSPVPIVFLVHPRTMSRLKQFNLYDNLANSKNIQLLPPANYLDFLVLMKHCRLILTDSGGIQEEATVPSIRKFVLVLRFSTERPEAVEAGFANIVGTDRDNILRALNDSLNKKLELPTASPFGDGRASERIVRIIK